MAGITLSDAQAQLGAWLAASEKVAQGQSYSVGERTLTRADAGRIQSMIDYWDRKCQELAGETNVARKIRVYGGTPA